MTKHTNSPETQSFRDAIYRLAWMGGVADDAGLVDSIFNLLKSKIPEKTGTQAPYDKDGYLITDVCEAYNQAIDDITKALGLDDE